MSDKAYEEVLAAYIKYGISAEASKILGSFEILSEKKKANKQKRIALEKIMNTPPDKLNG